MTEFWQCEGCELFACVLNVTSFAIFMADTIKVVEWLICHKLLHSKKCPGKDAKDVAKSSCKRKVQGIAKQKQTNKQHQHDQTLVFRRNKAAAHNCEWICPDKQCSHRETVASGWFGKYEKLSFSHRLLMVYFFSIGTPLHIVTRELCSNRVSVGQYFVFWCELVGTASSTYIDMEAEKKPYNNTSSTHVQVDETPWGKSKMSRSGAGRIMTNRRAKKRVLRITRVSNRGSLSCSSRNR